MRGGEGKKNKEGTGKGSQGEKRKGEVGGLIQYDWEGEGEGVEGTSTVSMTIKYFIYSGALYIWFMFAQHHFCHLSFFVILG